jgi:hypothetical protein
MIHHISISAHNPLRVSQVLAEILQGASVPFPGYPDSYVALALDAQGTMIEVHPFGTALFPGVEAKEASHLRPHPSSSHYSANHTAISVPMKTEKIWAIAQREGWRVVQCQRGDDYFDVIELWIENQLLIELLSPEIVSKYLTFMEPRSLLAIAQAAASQAAITI